MSRIDDNLVTPFCSFVRRWACSWNVKYTKCFICVVDLLMLSKRLLLLPLLARHSFLSHTHFFHIYVTWFYFRERHTILWQKIVSVYARNETFVLRACTVRQSSNKIGSSLCILDGKMNNLWRRLFDHFSCCIQLFSRVSSSALRITFVFLYPVCYWKVKQLSPIFTI